MFIFISYSPLILLVMMILQFTINIYSILINNIRTHAFRCNLIGKEELRYAYLSYEVERFHSMLLLIFLKK